MSNRKRNSRVRKMLVALILIAVILPVAHLGVARCISWRASRLYASCFENERAIATAAEIYSTENVGRFPSTLAVLVPRYLASVPTCPARGVDTYSAGYASFSNPDSYTVVCLGGNHVDAPELARDPDGWIERLGPFGAANQPVVSAYGIGQPVYR